MTDRFRNFATRHELWSSDDRILLAVSGGMDSMVMLDLFRNAGIAIGVAHANFKLRGQGADEDEQFVRKYCLQHQIRFYSRAFDTKNYAETSGVSIQMAARELRYAWFDDLLEEGQYHYLATAHHLNDNLETVLLRWAKGANLDQLTGIPPRNNKIIRPLLFATRQEIEAYAHSQKVSWREDPTNAGDDYHRNFIRNRVIPLLKEMNPSLETTFSRSLEKLSGAQELMRRGLEQLKDSITGTEKDVFYIDKNVVLMLKNPAVICYECLKGFGFEWDVCHQLAEALSGQSGKKFLSPTHLAVIDRDRILVSPRNEWHDEILIEEGQDKAALGPWKLSIRRPSEIKLTAGQDTAILDLDKIRFPLRWRKWQQGDVFVPLGLGHHKKVSDLLIDEKVPLPDKDSVTVIMSRDEIVWVVGHRLDNRFKVTPSTSSVIHLRVSSI